MTATQHLAVRRAPTGLFALALGVWLAAASPAQDLLITPDLDDGVYSPGQTIRWNVRAPSNDVSEAAFVLKQGGLTEVKRGTAKLSEGKGQIEA